MNMKDIRAALNLIRAAHTSSAPEYMQVNLQTLRALTPPSVRQDVRGFLEQTKELPGNVVCVLTAGRVSVLVDDDNRILCFR